MNKIVPLSFLLLFFGSLSASVVYTDINDTKITSGSQGVSKLKIDFNNDGTTDTEIWLNTAGSGSITIGTGSYTATYIGDTTWINPLNSGHPINNSPFSWGSDTSPAVHSAGSGNKFPTDQDRYIGVKFDIAGGTFFGWIRLNVKSGSTLDCTVFDYAYDDVMLDIIYAGDKGNGQFVGINLNPTTTFSLYPNPTSNMLQINYGNNGRDVYKVMVYSINGALIESFEEKVNSIDFSSYQKGQYLVSFQFNNKATETRKITVN